MNPVKSIARRSVRFLASLRLLSPKMTAILLHRIQLGRWPDLHNPKDLNEKIMWLEFNTDTSLWSRLADKYEVRSYLQEKGLGRYLLTLYGVYDSVDEIDFNALPDSFAIKMTNGYGQTILVHDKSRTDLVKLRRQIAAWGMKRFGIAGAEPHYSRIRPRIIAEQLLPVAEGELPIDYKFMCFNGKPDTCLLCSGRDADTFHCKFDLYRLPVWQRNINGINLPFRPVRSFAPPLNLDEMLKTAELIAKEFPFVRVDFYEVDGKMFIGELTFTPAAGRIEYITLQTLLDMGNRIDLPDR